MAISLVTQFQPYTDEIFTTESKKSLLTNQDFNWTGAHTIKVYKIGTSRMNDYSRNPAPGFTGSRYGEIKDLDATTEEFTLKNDRSFTFAIDKLDNDETAQQLAAASALARQVREIVVPEVDSYTYGVMCSGAGNKHYCCRNCAKLNYSSQQKSGMEEMRFKMERIVEKELGYTWRWRDYPDTPIQDLWNIPKPPYMRYEKYERLLGEFRQLQKDYESAFWTGLAKISYCRDIAEAAVQHLKSL